MVNLEFRISFSKEDSILLSLKNCGDKLKISTKRIDPNLLDLEMRESDFAIRYGKVLLTTFQGNEAIHKRPRLLQHIIRDVSLTRELSSVTLDSYSLFSIQKDLIENGRDPILANFEVLLDNDYFVVMKTRSETSAGAAEAMMNFLDENKRMLNLILGGFSSVMKSLNDFLLERNHGVVDFSSESKEEFFRFFKKYYVEMPTGKKAAVTALCMTHDSGLILPTLLANGHLAASEYVNALFSCYMSRNRNFIDRKTSREIVGDEDYFPSPLEPDWSDPETSFAELRAQTSNVLEYSVFFPNVDKSKDDIRSLIAKGESFDLEFKSTLRWHIKAERKDPAIEHAALKTIAGFLNTKGGTLLIGVRDDGSIEGIETDKFNNEDKFALHFWNLIKSSMGQDVTPFVNGRFEQIDGKTVFIVQCDRSARPVFLRHKNFDEEFFIRVGPSSAKLGISEALKYIGDSFHGK